MAGVTAIRQRDLQRLTASLPSLHATLTLDPTTAAQLPQFKEQGHPAIGTACEWLQQLGILESPPLRRIFNDSGSSKGSPLPATGSASTCYVMVPDSASAESSLSQETSSQALGRWLCE